MRYILDKNLLTNYVTENVDRRDDLCITEDVVGEAGFNDKEIAQMKNVGVKILNIGKKHLDKLSEVMASHGDNLKLINLSAGKGTADVMMIAYVLAEHHDPEILFKEEFTIVTKDRELTSVANKYGLECIMQLP